ncbi:MAG: His/Gly/Thr/Pro-type tRNA ligase C-terminal domain-containing protein, partial [Candidatus Levyibacteriota bacterium]
IEFYKKFGFEFDFRLATRPEHYAGTEKNWEKAEKDLEKALKMKKLKYTLKPQDGAFYGPKIDVHIKDSLGREWQLATVQLDFHQPEAFGLTYIDNEGKEIRPVMIHRAIFGSFERFIAILTEQFQGSFPVWLAPVQVAILPISDKVITLAKEVEKQMKELAVRAELDASAQTLGAKIRTHTLQRVPFLCIIGDKEVEKSLADKKNYVSVRTREGKDLGMQDVSAFLDTVQKTIEKRI